jgi:hypothetical protein
MPKSVAIRSDTLIQDSSSRTSNLVCLMNTCRFRTCCAPTRYFWLESAKFVSSASTWNVPPCPRPFRKHLQTSGSLFPIRLDILSHSESSLSRFETQSLLESAMGVSHLSNDICSVNQFFPGKSELAWFRSERCNRTLLTSVCGTKKRAATSPSLEGHPSSGHVVLALRLCAPPHLSRLLEC